MTTRPDDIALAELRAARGAAVAVRDWLKHDVADAHRLLASSLAAAIVERLEQAERILVVRAFRR